MPGKTKKPLSLAFVPLAEVFRLTNYALRIVLKVRTADKGGTYGGRHGTPTFTPIALQLCLLSLPCHKFKSTHTRCDIR